MTTLFDHLPPEEQPQPHPHVGETCRHCLHRVRYGNYHTIRVTQHCALQATRRNSAGLRRIKVTDPACPRFTPKDKDP